MGVDAALAILVLSVAVALVNNVAIIRTLDKFQSDLTENIEENNVEMETVVGIKDEDKAYASFKHSQRSHL